MVIAAGAIRNARVNRRHMGAVTAGWTLQAGAAFTLGYFGLVPAGHGVLWQMGAFLSLLIGATLFGMASGQIFGLRHKTSRGNLEIALQSFVTNLCVCGLCLLLFQFSLPGVFPRERA